jgi:transcriptional regulator with XRE-family HTH domain
MEVIMGKCKRTPHKSNINANIAKIFALHRIWEGSTQKRIAECIEVTFQQIQKYERCINRLPADHLIDICKQRSWDLSLFSNNKPYAIFEEWINNVDQIGIYKCVEKATPDTLEMPFEIKRKEETNGNSKSTD